MKNSRFIKRIVTGAVALAMSLSMLTGCSNGLSQDKNALTKEGGISKEDASSTKVLVIGDYDIYMDEVLFYAIQSIAVNKGTKDMVQNNPTYYKDSAISMLRTTKILYDVSQHNNVELTDEEKENAQKSIAAFEGRMPEGLLDKYGISHEVVEKAFLEQACVTKFENEIRTDMAETSKNDILDKTKDYNFVEAKYILFPTVETTAADEPSVDEKGNYVYLSDKDKEAVMDKAKAMAEELEAGGDVEELITAYGVDNYCRNLSGYVGSFNELINGALEGVDSGHCSEIVEETLGYVIIYVTSDHNDSLRESYASLVVSDIIDQQFSDLETQWLSTIAVDEEKDMIGTVWADYDLINIATDLENAGVVTSTTAQ